MVSKQEISSISDSVKPLQSEAAIKPSEIYEREMSQAKRDSFFGAWDMHLALAGLPAGMLLDTIQTEINTKAAKGLATNAGSSIVLNLAQLPVNWRGVSIAGVGYAITSGLRRATRKYTIGRDIEKTMETLKDPDTIGFSPHTESTYKKYNKSRKLRQAGVATSATVGGYLAGSCLGVNGELLVGTLAMTAAVGKVHYERIRSTARGF